MEREHGAPEAGPEERRALLAVWAIPGVGPKALAALTRQAGALAGLLERPLDEWVGALPLSPRVRTRLQAVPTLEALAERVLARVEATGMRVCYPGDAAFPAGLVGVPDAPPLLFYQGEVSPPRRWVAMVGSRRPDPGFLPFARRFACEVARGGVGVVSGAAEGVDRAAHWGALDAGAPTWAFLGSALDEMDAGQRRLAPHLLARGGTVFSELPPGVRANQQTFPRRNRLIAGAAHAVLVLRASTASGSLYTAHAARAQGRPVLALPGESTNPAALGCNGLIRAGNARLCLGVDDVWAALGVVGTRSAPSPVREEAAGETLSPAARMAYSLLARTPRAFEDLLAECALGSAALTSALSELELGGHVIQHPGKLYERV